MKKTLRKKVLEKRSSITSSEKKRKDDLIKHTLFNFTRFKEARTILFYASFGAEVDTISMIDESLKMDKKIMVPKVDNESRQLKLYEIKDLRELSPGFMGIPEPSLPNERIRQTKDVDLVIIPGTAFDYSGNRLGYGAGYYDILLSGTEKKIPLVALAYEEQLVNSIPSESHDVKVDIIITDKQVIKV